MKTTLKNIVIIILISAGLGFVYNSLSSNGLPLIRKEQIIETVSDADLHSASEDTLSSLKAISLDQAKQLHSEGIVFIDARDNWDFADGHIVDAINIPEFSFVPTDSNLQKLNKESLYVVYCGSDDCDLSKRLASELYKIGFNNLYLFLDGYEVWRDNNYPVEVNPSE